MANTITIPGLGAQPKQRVIIGGLVVVGFLGVAYYRAKQARDAAAASAPTTTDAQIDPSTGYAYGSASDAQSLTDAAGYQYGDTGYAATVNGYASGNQATNDSPVVSTNSQWTQRALELITATGAPSGPVSAALGKYMSGAGIVAGSAEDSYVTQAIALVGPPPSAGTNGFPPSIHHTAAVAAKPTSKDLSVMLHKRGNTWAALSTRYYGTSARWAFLRDAQPAQYHQYTEYAGLPVMHLSVPQAKYHWADNGK